MISVPPSSALALPLSATKKQLSPPLPPLPSPSPRRIPGPAGALQAAMENPGIHEDEDFSRNPWNFALDFVRTRQGLVGSENRMPIGTPLSEINTGFHFNKVPLVVAFVKSCKLTELGDLMVSLKDPTGTIDASIHRRVLTEGQFAKDLLVGAAIILEKVAVFSPSSSIRYLNITLNNVVKIMPKENEPFIKAASVAKHSATVVEACGKSRIPPKGFSLSPARTQGIMNNLRKASNERGATTVHADKKTVKDSMINGKKRLTVETEVGSVQVSKKVLEVSENLEEENAGANKKQRQPIISQGAIPDWTDEQLDELFA